MEEVKTLHIETQTIAYPESSGTGISFLLVHGNSASSKSLAQQLSSSFGATHRIIAIDLHTHGDSDPAAEPAGTYHLPGYAAVVAELVQQLGAGGRNHRWLKPGRPYRAGSGKAVASSSRLRDLRHPTACHSPGLDNAFLPLPAIGAAFVEDLTRD
jgi:hypothetical protein